MEITAKTSGDSVRLEMISDMGIDLITDDGFPLPEWSAEAHIEFMKMPVLIIRFFLFRLRIFTMAMPEKPALRQERSTYLLQEYAKNIPFILDL